jgi:hypothetical protein
MYKVLELCGTLAALWRKKPKRGHGALLEIQIEEVVDNARKQACPHIDPSIHIHPNPHTHNLTHIHAHTQTCMYVHVYIRVVRFGVRSKVSGSQTFTHSKNGNRELTKVHWTLSFKPLFCTIILQYTYLRHVSFSMCWTRMTTIFFCKVLLSQHCTSTCSNSLRLNRPSTNSIKPLLPKSNWTTWYKHTHVHGYKKSKHHNYSHIPAGRRCCW